MTNQEAINYLLDPLSLPESMDIKDKLRWHEDAVNMAIEALKAQPEKRTEERTETHACDLISRQAAIAYAISGRIRTLPTSEDGENWIRTSEVRQSLLTMPSAQPERKWIPCSNPPKHHRDVIVRGIEAIGNVTVHKVMQWDVDTWRPTDYAPSIKWEEWSEI